MTTTIITDKPTVHTYTATAAQDTFGFGFQIFNGSEDIEVYVDDVETGAFTVNLIGSEGGEVVLDTPCSGGEVVTVLRRIARKRITMFGNAGPVAMSSVDQEFNRLVGLLQDVVYDFGILSETVGYTDEDARDMLATALVAGTNVTIDIDDPNDTITINGLSDAEIKDVIYTKLLPGVGLEMIDNGSTLTINATGGGGGGGLTTEDVRDTIGAALVAGTGITITVNDPSDTITIAATSSYTDEQARDAIGAALVAGTGMSVSVNDGADTITLSQTLTKTLQIPIPAGAMKPASTSGAAAATIETTTNKLCFDVYDFDSATDEYVQFQWPMPKQWNEGTITAQFLWTNTSGSGNVVWGIQAVAIGDDDVLDAAWGTAVTVTDGVTAAGDLMISAATSAMTVAGTPASEDLVMFRIYRDADNASDTLGVDARLVGVRLKISVNAFDDA